LPDWIPNSWTLLLPGTALWALAFYLPLSGPLSRLEEALAAGSLAEDTQQLVLVGSSLLLALAVGAIANLALGWALGPGWGTSLGLMAALYGLFWGLASGRGDRD
jgi:predicted membrane metal-binding protein